MIDPSNLYLPNSDPQRLALHNEVHTRPSATFQLPALIVYVAVMNSKISIADECQHLRKLKGQEHLNPEQLKGNFLQLQCDHFKIIWERHTEFTRYTIIQPLPQHAHWGSQLPELASHVATGVEWLKGIPGTTITAGSGVTLEIASGNIQVPSLVGLSEINAKTVLTQAGFLIREITASDPAKQNGEVLAQAPEAGATKTIGSVVTITINRN